MPEIFNTITGADWKRSIAEARARPNRALEQILAAIEKMKQKLNSGPVVRAKASA